MVQVNDPNIHQYFFFCAHELCIIANSTFVRPRARLCHHRANIEVKSTLAFVFHMFEVSQKKVRTLAVAPIWKIEETISCGAKSRFFFVFVSCQITFRSFALLLTLLSVPMPFAGSSCGTWLSCGFVRVARADMAPYGAEVLRDCQRRVMRNMCRLLFVVPTFI